MYYYAYIDSSYCVTGVYAMPTEINMNGYISITQDQYTNGNLVGKYYDPDTGLFEAANSWVCNTDYIQYKSTNDTLTEKLDGIDTAIAAKADDADLHEHTNKTVIDGITAANVAQWNIGTAGADGADGASAYDIAVSNGFTGTESQWLASLVGEAGADGADGADGASAYEIAVSNGFSGTQAQWLESLVGDAGAAGVAGSDGLDGADGTTVVVGTTTTGTAGTNASVSGTLNSSTNTLTLDFTIPRGDAGESGSSASVTANEILTKLKTVDGADSGLDADTLDGIQATGFASASHTHDDYLTADDISGLATTSAMNTALSGKADSVHSHSNYAAADDFESLETTVSGKANSNHTHTLDDVSETTSKKVLTAAERTKLNGVSENANNYSHPTSHAASMITGLADVATSGSYNDLDDRPTTMTPAAHAHTQSDITGLSTALSGKANSSHGHAQSDITGLSTALNGKANSSHGHAQSEITGLASALNGKAAASHTHTASDVSGTFPISKGGTGATTAAAALSNLGLTATAAEINKLDGLTATTSELNYTDGVTSNIQTQLNGKAASAHTHTQYATLSQVYPVGAIYISVSNTNPSTLFGGTWVAFAAGRTLVGVTSNGTAEYTGGSETATLAAHSHTTQSHALTIAEMPIHHHELLNYNVNGYTNDTFTNNSVEGLTKKGFCGNVMTSYAGGNNAHSHGNTGSAGGATIDILPPFITCYMWKRTA